jgi:hypothetical protein
MTQKKKRPSGNPARKSNPLIDAVFKRLVSGVQLTKELQDHVTPLGDCLITLEQWRYLRGSVVADLALYAQLAGKPSPIDLIITSERDKVLIDF